MVYQQAILLILVPFGRIFPQCSPHSPKGNNKEANEPLSVICEMLGHRAPANKAARAKSFIVPNGSSGFFGQLSRQIEADGKLAILWPSIQSRNKGFVVELSEITAERAMGCSRL
ncbi:predicted protein [Uncinocarpus reesii 1704]|uniref:Uncharacterized protein n=1 Tax=Uncinocarpus reesii (strain UAMH 1704) TaxID=336963 RepID=C4JTM3_UNCRE|nr:uncharacterized protein UREG_05812 [Uncinocarpus reesii 1704]EEP80970.1 predicted protein [Uncinocarpus reesii 1704]